jgi:hypothetical protein
MSTKNLGETCIVKVCFGVRLHRHEVSAIEEVLNLRTASFTPLNIIILARTRPSGNYRTAHLTFIVLSCDFGRIQIMEA